MESKKQPRIIDLDHNLYMSAMKENRKLKLNLKRIDLYLKFFESVKIDLKDKNTELLTKVKLQSENKKLYLDSIKEIIRYYIKYSI